MMQIVILDLQLGTQYKIRQTTFQKYIDDLLAKNARGRSSYLAVQNIKKAFPQIEVGVWFEALPEKTTNKQK